MMMFNVFKNTVLLCFFVMISCGNFSKTEDLRPKTNKQEPKPIVGANQTDNYLPLLQGKRVGIVANQTSVIFKQNGYTHLVDSLLALKIDIKNVFAPEHGFRGTADAGEHIRDGIDNKTKLPIISLYGSNRKPNKEQLNNIDIMIFDIQDVGARFYTYISTLHYVMEACAETNIPMLILDRPNPNGHYIDGPVLETENKSFVGMHPIPITHGMTIGEYAQMINGEKWLENGVQCNIIVIPVTNYTHQTSYSLPIKPSPNLPNDTAINLYPSLCLFEGTNVSVGRGTTMQFQVVGSPYHRLKRHYFEFTPEPNESARYPKHEGIICYGYDLRNEKKLSSINLSWLIDFYRAHKNYSKEKAFFNTFFTKLAGTKKLQQQIEAGLSEADIKSTWQEGINAFKKTRAKYLLYP